MSLLNDLGRKYKTDKSSDGKKGEVGAGHNYLDIYDRHLSVGRESALKILEIGVRGGASLRMWRDYYPAAQIYGLDINESALAQRSERIDVRLIDQSDAGALKAFAQECGPFDLILDDGSHIWAHQIISLKALLDSVVPGGKYIIEDLQTSYSSSFSGGSDISCIDYLLKCFEKVIADKNGSKLHQHDELTAKIDRHVDSMLAMRFAAILFKKQVEA